MNIFLALFIASLGGLLLAQARLSAKFTAEMGILALCFLLVGLQIEGLSSLSAGFCGFAFSLLSTGRSLLALRLPVIVSVLMAVSQSILWTLFALCAFYFLQLPLLSSVVAIACVGTALSWLEWSILPLWGTAQNFSCTFPINRPFIALMGASGGTWSALFVAAWLANFYSSQSDSRETFIINLIGTGVMAMLFALSKLSRSMKSSPSLRVAVFGWAGTEFDSLISLNLRLTETVHQASEAGAKILVTPEAAIHVEDRAAFRLSLQSLAVRYKIALAIGYFDAVRRENCIDLVDASGEIQGRYVKTHLVPVFETYQAGKGEIALIEVDGVKIGGLICQDDNFPDIARKYAKAGVQLLVVPTNDWKNVKDLHFASHRWRALEFRFALARAASDGISSLMHCNGDVLKQADHFQTGAKLLVGDVTVGSGKPTLYTRIGDLFPVLCGLFALGCLIFAR